MFIVGHPVRNFVLQRVIKRFHQFSRKSRHNHTSRYTVRKQLVEHFTHCQHLRWGLFLKNITSDLSDKDESINNASNNISTSSLNQMDDVNTEKSKPITRMVLSGVQQGNIEVFGKRHKHVWKPSVENGYKNTDLLGTVD